MPEFIENGSCPDGAAQDGVVDVSHFVPGDTPDGSDSEGTAQRPLAESEETEHAANSSGAQVGVKTSPTFGDADRVDSTLSVKEGDNPTYTAGGRTQPDEVQARGVLTQERSALGKSWKMPRSIEPDQSLIDVAGGSTMLARLLLARGISTAAEALSFLDIKEYAPTDPLELPNIAKALTRLGEALTRQEHITIYGDYDVDGVTGTSVLYTVLKGLGASVDYYIPNRASEGYGLNLKAISILASKHRTKLIVTCDCGVSNFAEINFAKSLGVDSLVLDHHTMPEVLPPAIAIVHPKLMNESHPLFNLPGVGVAYKVCEALLAEHGKQAEVPELLDYVTLGMIADMVPLISENRYLVRIGLPVLAKSQRPGIRALLSKVASFDDTDIVGFGLAPRINAVGRLSDANAAVELLTTDSEEIAQKLAQQLEVENTRRQELCEEIFVDADRQIAATLDLSKDKAIAIFGKSWHHGVVGIVASRLVEKYARPVFIGELDEGEGVVKGSARSIDGIDLYEVLKANDHLLSRWGGHKMAAGFAVAADRAQAACRAIVETCNRMLINKSSVPILNLDLVAQPEEVNLDLARLITKMAPFGMGNKKPVFCLQAVTCSASRPLGKEGKHSRIMVLDKNQSTAFECVMWSCRGRVPRDSTVIDIAFTPEVNSFNGRERLQLVLADWRVAAGSAATASMAQPHGEVTGRPSGSTKKTEPIQEATAQTPTAAPTNKGRTIEEIARVPSVVDNDDLEKIALKSATQQDLLTISKTEQRARVQQIASIKYNWKDLRTHSQAVQIVHRALQTLGDKVAIFAESSGSLENVSFSDRTAIRDKEHVIFWQMPPSEKVFQEILANNKNCTVYLLGADHHECDDPANFLKRMFGLIRYAVNKKDGQIQGEKLTASLGATKMSVALGLTIFRRVSLIDWFSEEGCIYLDLLGAPTGETEELAEYKQLVDSLQASKEFRSWCLSSRLGEIQLAVTPNHVGAAPQLPPVAASDAEA